MPIKNPQSKFDNSFTNDGADMGSPAIRQNDRITMENYNTPPMNSDTSVYGEIQFGKSEKSPKPNIK
jgi:hypothetical protein